MKKRILALAVVLAAIGLQAQEHNENVTIEGVYKPKITKFDKLRFTPEVEKDVYSVPEFKVALMPLDFNSTVETEILSPVRLTDRLSTVETTENFLMAAFGSRLSPEFMYRHNSELTKTAQLGVGLKHASSWLDIKDYAPSAFMNNDFYVSLLKDFAETQLKSEVFYKNDQYHYYGEPDPLHLINADDIKQVYNTVGLKSQMFSKKAGFKTLNYKVGAEYNLTFAGGGLFENWFSVDGSLNYMANWFGYENAKQIAGADIDVDVDALKQFNILVGLRPYFDMKGEFFKLRLGMRVDASNSATGNISVYPDFAGSLFVLDNKVEFYAGINGGSRLVRFATLIEENPFLNVNYFLNTSREQAITRTKFGFEGGVRTNIVDRFDLHFDVKYRKAEHEAFFVQDFTGGINAFALVFDDCGILRLNAEARWQLNDKVGLNTSFIFGNYSCATLDHAPYKSAVNWLVAANYDVTEKLSLEAEGRFISKRYAYVYDDAGALVFEPLKPFFDMQVKAGYAISEQFSAFVKLSDLLFSKYQLYYNYPVAGFQGFAGFTLCF